MRFTRKTGMQDDGASSDVDPEEPRSESVPAGKSAKSHVDPNAPRRDSVTAGKSAKSRPQQRKAPKRGYLDGQMLIAMPSMGDDRFTRSVIYVCAHSTEGAMGIIVNQPAAHISFADLLVQLDVIPAAEIIQLPRRAGGVKVLKGGPVDTQRGFVLHSSDFFIENSTLPIDEGICLTATLDILKAIARGDGPQSAILALGYAGWAPGQLEDEIQRNGWLTVRADLDLIFNVPPEKRYEAAMHALGVNGANLSEEAGHA